MTKVQRYKVGFLIPADSGFVVKFEDYSKLETELAANAALELEVARLRSVMADVIKAHGYTGGTPIEALSTPLTPTALNELIEKVEKLTIERCARESERSHSREQSAYLIRALPTGQIKLEELL